MTKTNQLKVWTLIIPLAIVALLVAFDIWPGKAIRIFHFQTVKSNRELVGAFGGDDWEWAESGEGYQADEIRMVRHGDWVETYTDPYSGTWRCEGQYRKDLRHGAWTVRRDGEIFREFVFKSGRPVKVINPGASD